MGHSNLAFRPKINFAAKTQPSEVIMADCKDSEVKSEDDEKPAKKPCIANKLEVIGDRCEEADGYIGTKTYEVIAGTSGFADLNKHAKDLRKALANDAAAEDSNDTQTDGKGKNKELIDLMDSSEALEYSRDIESSTQKSCCSIKQSTPKSFNDAVGYLEKVKVRFAFLPSKARNEENEN